MTTSPSRTRPRRSSTPWSPLTGHCGRRRFYAGLRRGELVALRWEDVNLAEGVIRVRRGWDPVEGEIAPKTAKGKRTMPVPAVLRDHLVEHRMSAPGQGKVFGTLPEVRRAAERARDRWENAGLTPITLHAARHTYASLMIAAGGQREGALDVHGAREHRHHA